MHRTRAWSVVDATVEEAAHKLAEHVWVTCTGFRLVGPDGVFYVLNDSTGADGAQEYAVVRVAEERDGTAAGVEVESLTVSWMEEERIAEYLAALLLGGNTSYGAVVVRRHARDARCSGCA